MLPKQQWKGKPTGLVTAGAPGTATGSGAAQVEQGLERTLGRVGTSTPNPNPRSKVACTTT